MRPCRIYIYRFAEKQLRRIPAHVRSAFYVWASDIESRGLIAVRRSPGYHDEPLKGSRSGQRSIRLSRSYRVIYEEDEQNNLTIVGIREINKHDY